LAAILAKAAAAKEALKKKLEETPAPPVAPAVSPALSTLLGQKNAELATRLSSNPAALSALERAKKQAAVCHTYRPTYLSLHLLPSLPHYRLVCSRFKLTSIRFD